MCRVLGPRVDYFNGRSCKEGCLLVINIFDMIVQDWPQQIKDFEACHDEQALSLEKYKSSFNGL